MKIYFAGNQVCMKRGLDTERFKRYFAANGWTDAETAEDADVVIAVTCAFVSSYTATAVGMLEELKKQGKRLVVYGCLPDMAHDEFEKVFSGEFFSTKNPEGIEEFFPEFTVKLCDVQDSFEPDVNVMSPFDPDALNPVEVRNNVKSRKPAPILRISEGCNNSCSYCSHPMALGRLKSKPLEECVSDYLRILDCGHKRVTIHANDPASYGEDIGLSYPELLNALDKASDDESVKWSLNDVHPCYLLKYGAEIIRFIQKGRVVQIGIPLQSGSPEVLRQMNRVYDIEKVTEMLCRLRTEKPELVISTHLIAGFPGETEEDIELTADIFRKVKIDFAFIFRYSANKGTRAAGLTWQNSPEDIAERQMLLTEKISAHGCKTEIFL